MGNYPVCFGYWELELIWLWVLDIWNSFFKDLPRKKKGERQGKQHP